MPVIGNQTINFTSADVGTSTTGPGGLKTVTKETGNIFATTPWLHAGVYTYAVEEQSGTYTTATGETMAYSGGKYDITVYVQNGTSGVFIYAIATTITVVDNAGQAVGDKVDATPGGTGVVGDYSKLIFTNTFVKNNGGVNPATGSVLNISKAVDGAYGDQSKYFPYNLTVTQAATLPSSTVYKVFVLDASNTVVTSTANYAGTILTDTTYGNYIQVNAGATPTIINLKHGQKPFNSSSTP